MNLIKPCKLNWGDTVGIVSPSSGLAATVPHRVERGIKMLSELGLNARFSTNALKQDGYVSGKAKERADDINSFFLDKEIGAVITTIGGNHSNQILEYLDFELIRKNPKIFVGYSDATVIHLALQRECSLSTFYGPALLTQFGEYPEILSYTKEYFLKALYSSLPIGFIERSSAWTDEYLDWSFRRDLERPRKIYFNKKRIWLRKGYAKGRINGGCITSLQHIKGTRYWPDFAGCIFFIDIPESEDLLHGVKPDIVDSLLTDLEILGAFKDIAGMVVGRSYRYTEDEDKALFDIILECTKKYSFPILCNTEIGHTDPIITIPLGVETKLCSETDTFQIMEAGVK